MHEVEIKKGQKIEKHLCDDHAAEEGIATKDAYHAPINELLTNFVKSHHEKAGPPQKCDSCQMTFAEFREHSLLGCPQCYTAMDSVLGTLLERAHEGGTHHVGKAPQHFEDGERRHEQLLRMRSRLEDAVSAEDYELAARLRDDILRFEGQDS
ncbi:MAG: hypothetical protein CMJ18_11235 [Phycisphaeraceae bacterium]|nr:hypothetical protein [Phycisphaeraceae bacterium]